MSKKETNTRTLTTKDTDASPLKKTNGEVLNFHENALLKLVVGVVNLKRWNELKIVFCCKSNEDFVSKLLDIAEKYLTNNGTGNISKKTTKSKIQIVPQSKFKIAQVTSENVQQKPKIEIISSESIQKILQTPKPLHKNLQNTEAVNNPAFSTEVIKNSTPQDTNQIKPPEVKEEKSIKKKKPTTPKTTSTSPKSTKSSVPKKEKVDVRKAPHLETQAEKVQENNEELPADLGEIRVATCQNCFTRHIEDHCPINYPHFIIGDSIDVESWDDRYREIHENSSNQIVKSEQNEDTDSNKFCFARVSLPNLLTFQDKGENHGLSVVSKAQIQPFTQFGPLLGKSIKEVDIPDESDMKDIWEISIPNQNTYLSTSDLLISNWMRYVRPAPTREEKNLTVIIKEQKIYFVSVKFINEGEELLYWQDITIPNSKKKLEKTLCGGCNMTFAHPLYYRTHCSVFHDFRYSLTIRKYHCKVCGASVLGKENIVKHAVHLHNGQGAYQCQYCKKFFLRLNYLDMHRTYGCSANPHRARPLCDFCGKKFCQPQKLKVHIKRMHSGVEILKEFQCKMCSKILGSRAALQRHTKEVHEKSIDGVGISCVRCGKHFQNKSNLKIHMLTHSGIKPFRCAESSCMAAFTTKQCLQFHYKKVHNYTDDNMPKIERSVDYTFKAYSGLEAQQQLENMENNDENYDDPDDIFDDRADDDRHSDTKEDMMYIDEGSLDSKTADDPPALQSPLELPENHPLSPSPRQESALSRPSTPQQQAIDHYVDHLSSSMANSMKVVSKGSKKWMADEVPLHSFKASDFYSIERLSKDDLAIHDNELYDRKLSNMTEFTRHEPSNASLLVEAALDSVCSEPNMDIDVSSAPNCTDSLVNNLYTLAQQDNLPEVNYTMDESRDISLMSPSVNDHISVTDELGDELRQSQNIGLDYSTFHQDDFSPAGSPSNLHRSNFVKNYINSLSPTHNNPYEVNKNMSPVPSPPRYDFGHGTNNDHLSSDDSNGMAAQNLSLHGAKNDLSIYKPTYKLDYLRRLKFDGEGVINNPTNIEEEVDIGQDLSSGLHENDDRLKSYHDELSAEIRSKFELDLDLRLKSYENMDAELLRTRANTYDSIPAGNTDLDFRSKNYDLIESAIESRTGLDNEFRPDRNFEPLVLNSSAEHQGLDMSARSFHNYSNLNRFHHLYPDVDRVDLRLNYSPPPPPPPPYDLMRVVSLDLTPPGRHSVDLSLRSHPFNASRLLSEHPLQTNHRLLDQSRLLTSDLSTSRLGESRLLSETAGRILSDHTTNRILGNNDHLLGSEQTRLLSDEPRLSLADQSRLLEQRPLLGDGRILAPPPATPSGTVSPPVAPFSGYAVGQAPYHPTPLAAPRPHSPSVTPYHPYTGYY